VCFCAATPEYELFALQKDGIFQSRAPTVIRGGVITFAIFSRARAKYFQVEVPSGLPLFEAYQGTLPASHRY
jgi:hypothetical protein